MNKFLQKKAHRVFVLVTAFLMLFSVYVIAGLNMQVALSNNACSNDRQNIEIFIENTGSTTYDIDELYVRFYYYGSFTANGNSNWYNRDLQNPNYNNSVNIAGTTVAIPECIEAADRKADHYVQIALSSTYDLQPGQTIRLNGAITGANPFDSACDDYSGHGAFSRTDDLHFVLFDSAGVVLEETAPGVTDPDTGVEPCSIPTATPTNTFESVVNVAYSNTGATSVATVEIIPETPTPTETFTSTNTNTNTPTVTPTDTPTNTNTPTDTFTDTPTFTFTDTFTDTSTFTFTDTPTDTFTPTDTSTDTPTYTFTDTATDTATFTDTPTDTFTDTPTDTFTDTPTFTFTDTATDTATYTFTATFTDTNTNDPTATDTDTFTDTPTFTFTDTPTDTFTDTPTNTFTDTNTDTPTFTFTDTPTDTPTFTDTYTPTETFTGVPIDTWTDTYTPTFTYTDTPTYTFTDTFTDTPTFTFTDTPTSTYSDTPTFTFTDTATDSPTFTSTYTPTDTATGIPIDTWTPTYTFTDTFTATDTFTFTNTFTDTPTFTFTDTPTNTFTFTDTWTETPLSTYTPTYTFTESYTFTNTFTNTNTPTDTFTPTSTFTDTNTRTYTNTPTETNTFTNTSTYTYTWTNTPTYTFTNTWTDTNTYTPTSTHTWTYTFTSTFTDTNTRTFTPTYTFTNTDTPTHTFTNTHTETPSFTYTTTDTPTYTPTPIQYPYVLRIEAFNEAGESVRLVTETRISHPISDVAMYANGVTTTAFNPAEFDASATDGADSGGLQFVFDGIMTPDQVGGDYSSFVWDGLNDNGQDIGNGIYYIQITATDEYGHMETVNKEVQVLRSEEFVRINVYNTAGELVRKIDSPLGANRNVSLGIDDVLYVGKDTATNPILINYAQGETVMWDGLNEQGKMVSSGVYEIKVEVHSADGYAVEASKTVSILIDANQNVLGDIKAYPNPFVVPIPGISEGVKFEWSEANEGKVTIRIFNLHGELVKVIYADMASQRAEWRLNSAGNEPASSGLYIAVLEGKKATGEIEVKKIKVVIMQMINNDNEDVLN